MEFHCLNMMLMLMINRGNFRVLKSPLFLHQFYILLYHFIGADITDYFNYGFTEETWKLYCERQRQMKSEVGQLNKTVSGFAPAHLLVGPRTCNYSNNRLVSYYYYNNNIALNYSAFIAVLMLNHIFNISINNNYRNFGWALFRINIIMHYMVEKLLM